MFKKKLVLDLDNTLIYHSFSYNYDNVLDYTFLLMDDKIIYIYKRDHLDDFLNNLCEYYDIYIFTASLKKYAKLVVKCIDPMNKYFKKVYTREDCIKINDHEYTKDLTIIDDNLNNIVIIDDNPISFILQKNNGIVIDKFNCKKHDNALNKLEKLLIKYKNTNDIRDIIKYSKK